MLALTALCLAGNHVIGRTVHADIPPLGLSFWRWMAGALVLSPFVFFSSPLRSWQSQNPLLVFIQDALYPAERAWHAAFTGMTRAWQRYVGLSGAEEENQFLRSELAGLQSRIMDYEEQVLENEHVRVWKSIILPNQPLALHRHDHGRTIVALKGGTLDVVDGKGQTIKKMTWETGKAYWLDVDPPGQQHGDLNRGTEAIEVIVVEMKK